MPNMNLEPGSEKAVAQGCVCPPLRWVNGQAPVLIVLACRVHVPRKLEKGKDSRPLA